MLLKEGPGRRPGMSRNSIRILLGIVAVVTVGGVIRAVVEGRPGVPFRAVVDLHEPAGVAERVWNRAADLLPPLREIWTPSAVVVHTMHGPWCQLPEGTDPIERGDPVEAVGNAARP